LPRQGRFKLFYFSATVRPFFKPFDFGSSSSVTLQPLQIFILIDTHFDDTYLPMIFLYFPVFAFIGLSGAVTNLTSDGSIDASGFQKCQDAATVSTTACLNKADADGSQLETLACGCTNYIENYNCYAAHCWNRVNECEYQTYVVEYLEGCPSAKLPVPYFPTPSNAADACSCNLGDVFLAITGYIQQGASCSTNASTTTVTDTVDSVQQIQGCECCEISASLSRPLIAL